MSAAPHPDAAPRPGARLAGLSIADPPERWAALGFAVHEGQFRAGAVTLTLGIAPQGGGIVGWALAGLAREGDIGGLRTRRVAPSEAERPGLAGGVARGVDHVVILTPAFDALAAELAERGLALRRIARVRGTQMGFRRLGGPILEIVEAPAQTTASFWGVTFAVPGAPGEVGSLDELCARTPVLGEPRPAIQPGRRIAAVRAEAGLSTRVAFIDPEP
jgi:hypothetical protein